MAFEILYRVVLVRTDVSEEHVLHLQGKEASLFTVKMKATCSSETSVLTWTTLCNISKDFHHCSRRENIRDDGVLRPYRATERHGHCTPCSVSHIAHSRTYTSADLQFSFPCLSAATWLPHILRIAPIHLFRISRPTWIQVETTCHCFKGAARMWQLVLQSACPSSCLIWPAFTRTHFRPVHKLIVNATESSNVNELDVVIKAVAILRASIVLYRIYRHTPW
jgi:hypothetical protein